MNISTLKLLSLIFSFLLLILFGTSLFPVHAASRESMASSTPTYAYVGPRGNAPAKTPIAHGFWSFAVPMPGILSRSGQPTLSEFQWLKKNGWRSVIDLRFDNEYRETADDIKLPGFKKLGFNYLHLPIRDGAAPTDRQAELFLKFVNNTDNQPVHIHCRGGYGRTGTLIALYRYQVQRWPMNATIAESALFHGGISVAQKKWLLRWSHNH